MRYVTHVVAVFPASRQDAIVFDVWENIAIVEAGAPRDTLERATALSRGFLDDDANCATLGFEQADLYGVRALNSAVELPDTREPQRQNPRILVKLRSIDKADLDKLRSFDEIPARLQLMHVEMNDNDV
jgi:hypothetical protein